MVDDDIKTMQNIVGGYIEAIGIANGILMVCNEEGKLRNLPFNFYCGDPIVGTAFFCATAGEEFASITEKQIQFLNRIFVEEGV